MKLLFFLIIVGVCVVSAKYLPDESNNFKQLLSRHKRSDSEDSSSNDTDVESDEETEEQSQIQARIEKMRLKLLEIQEKEKRKQEEARRKIEEKIAKELQKEEEKRVKEEEKRQRELQKEEEKRVKEEEKRQKELQKREEKLKKERQKLEEEQQKLREKALKNEQKRQKILQKQSKDMENNTPQLQEGDNISSELFTDESTELEDFWKNYIYSKYEINESYSDLEKKMALKRYLQEELGLNVNSTTSERRQAVLRLVESKLQTVSDQYVLQSQLMEFVNNVGVQKIRAQLEKEIEELNNKTDILSNVDLPWVSVAKEDFEEQLSFLQTIKEFLSSILPNWFNENIYSPESKTNETSDLNAKTSTVKLLDFTNSIQNENITESPLLNSNNKNDERKPNMNDLGDVSSLAVTNSSNSSDDNVLSFGNNSNAAPESTVIYIDNNSIVTETSETIPREDASTKNTENNISSIMTEKNSYLDESISSDVIVPNVNTISKTVTSSVSGIGSDLAHGVIQSENEGESNSSIVREISFDPLINEKDTTVSTLDKNGQETNLKISDGLMDSNNESSGNQNSFFNTVSTNPESSKDLNVLLPTTRSSQLNTVTNIADSEVGIGTGLINTDADYSSSLSPDDISNTIPINTQDSTLPTSNIESTNKNNIIVSDSVSIMPDSSTEIIIASSETVPLLVNDVTSDINRNNNSGISTNSNIKNESSTDNNFSSNITSHSNNGGKTITKPNVGVDINQIPVIFSEATKVIENVLLNNSQSQNAPKTTGSIITNDDTYLPSVTPSTFGSEKVELNTIASEVSNTLNTIVDIVQNASTNIDEIVSDVDVTEHPVTLVDTQTTLISNHSTIIINGAQQENNNTEDQYLEKNVTLSNTEQTTVTETMPEEVVLESTISPEPANNELIKNQEKQFDGITVPLEYGASVVDIAKQ